MKSALSLVALLAFACACSNGLAQVSGNLGLQSDYIWRGVTQTGEDPGFFADIEAEWENGFYLGAWTGNVLELGSDMEYELDGYLGWQRETESGFRYGAGYIYYYFTTDAEPGEDLNFGEVNGLVGYRWLDVSYSHDPDTDNNYLEANLSFELPSDFALGVHAGHYNYTDSIDADDWAIDVTKTWGQLVAKLAYASVDWDGTDDRFFGVLSWHWGD